MLCDITSIGQFFICNLVTSLTIISHQLGNINSFSDESSTDKNWFYLYKIFITGISKNATRYMNLTFSYLFHND